MRYKIYVYDADKNLFPNIEPIEVHEVEANEHGRLVTPDQPPNVMRWYRVTQLSEEEEVAAHAATPEHVPFPRIEVYKGRDGIWRYHLREESGKVEFVNPEKFSRKWTAKRGAKRFAKKLDWPVPIVVLTTDQIMDVASEQARKRDAAERAAKAAAKDAERTGA